MLGPGLVAGLALHGHRVGDPEPLAGLGVVRHDRTPCAAVAAGEAQNHLAVGDQRGMGVPQPGRVVAGAHLPPLLPRQGVQGDQRGIRRAPVDRVAVDRHAPVPHEGLRTLDVLGVAPLVQPRNVARHDVERGDPAAAFGHVHQPVGDDRRRDPARDIAHRIGPDEPQVADVRAVDLVERAEPRHVVGPPIAHPVAVLRVEQPVRGDRLPVDRRLRRGAAPHGETGPDQARDESSESALWHLWSPRPCKARWLRMRSGVSIHRGRRQRRAIVVALVLRGGEAIMQSKRLRRAVLIALVVGAGANAAPAWLSGSAPAAGTATAQARSLPIFEVDGTWPTVPAEMKLGAPSSIAIDAQDNVWVLHRPATLPPEQAAMAAPPVVVFDTAGNFIRAWGGAGAGYEWPQREHGLHIDHEGFVWLGGNNCPTNGVPRVEPVNDDQLLKFTQDGTFVMQIGRSDGSSGNADTMNLHRPADQQVHQPTNELFVADGYGNRRVAVFDAETGRFQAHVGRIRQSAGGRRPVSGAEPDQLLGSGSFVFQRPPRHPGVERRHGVCGRP